MNIPDVSIAPVALRETVAAARDSKASGAVGPSSTTTTPIGTDDAKPLDGSASAAQADQALGNINATLELSSVSVRFELDPKTDKVITKVVDIHSGDVISQMPSEVAIRISKALDKLQGLLVNEKI